MPASCTVQVLLLYYCYKVVFLVVISDLLVTDCNYSCDTHCLYGWLSALGQYAHISGDIVMLRNCCECL